MFVDSATTELLYGLLYDPTTWSQEVNGDVYSAVTIILRIAEAHNVTIPGSRKYNIPTGNISLSGSDSTPTLVSYTSAAIAGADDFSDSGVTIKDVFDVIVSNTREVTPTCEFSVISLRHVLLTYLRSSWNSLVAWVRTELILF